MLVQRMTFALKFKTMSSCYKISELIKQINELSKMFFSYHTQLMYLSPF